MASWQQALSRTRARLANAMAKLMRVRDHWEPADLEELEEVLLLADVPVRLADQLIQAMEEGAVAPGDRPQEALRSLLIEALGPDGPSSWTGLAQPHGLLVVGVNGAGKTTTCAKLAHKAKAAGLRPLLGATDTFRAAGAEQLSRWGEVVNCDVVAGAPGADAAAVAYDAMDAAVARSADLVVLDTAGRMHTKQPLMEELRKISRAMAKRVEGAPHDVWLVLDGSMGQNAITQARVFDEAVNITGLVITKLDGSSKAGFLFSVAKDLGVPVRYVGLGEAPDDLVPFRAEAFVDALLDTEPADQGAAR